MAPTVSDAVSASAKCVWIAASDRSAPGDVDQRRRHCRVELVDLVVGDHLVVETEVLDEDPVALRGHADAAMVVALGEALREADRCLRRGAGDEGLRGAEEVVVGEVVVDEERRHEHAPQQEVLVGLFRAEHHVGRDVAEVGVGRGVLGAVSADVAEGAAVRGGVDDDVGWPSGRTRSSGRRPRCRGVPTRRRTRAPSLGRGPTRASTGWGRSPSSRACRRRRRR